MGSGLNLMSTLTPEKYTTFLPSTPGHPSYRREAFYTIPTVFICGWTKIISTQGYYRILKTSLERFGSFLRFRQLEE